MSSWGDRVLEERRKQKQRHFEEIVQAEIEEMWTAYSDRAYARSVRLCLRLFFRLSEQPYSPWRFTVDLECTGQQHGALFELVDHFEELAEERRGIRTDHDGTVPEPVEVLPEIDTAEIWGAFDHHSTLTPATDRLEWSLSLVEQKALDLAIVDEPGEDCFEIGDDFEESELYEMWTNRQEQGRTAQALIVGRNGSTGVGKSTLAIQLCRTFDDGWSADKACNTTGEYHSLLHDVDKQSVILADEYATMYDARRAMSSDSVEGSHKMQMLRKLEVSTIGTTPAMSAVDKRFLTYMDIQIIVTRRGHARVYRLKEDDQDGSLYREHWHNVEWGHLDGDEDYQAVEEMKQQKLEGNLGDHSDEESEEIDREEIEREKRNEIIQQLHQNGMSQTDIASHFDMSQPAISDIVN